MSDELVFMMGKFEARFPTDRKYARNHLWLKEVVDGSRRYRAGFTAYSVRLLKDVYFLSWTIDEETSVAARQEIGEIESSKALSTIYSPAKGTIHAFNQQLLADPTPINLDQYESGWLFEISTDDELLDAPSYIVHLAAGWDETQRLIKGQMNE